MNKHVGYGIGGNRIGTIRAGRASAVGAVALIIAGLTGGSAAAAASSAVTTSQLTPSILGAYLGNPNGSTPSAEAAFENSYRSFSTAMKNTPKLINAYVDYTQSVANWPSNASWQAWSNAQSPLAKSMAPVIGFPMASLASGSGTPDQQFQAFAAGKYDSYIQAVVAAWTQQGFKTLVFRLGWEMNLQGNTYSGSDFQSEQDWVAAFQHIYQVLHAAGAVSGATVEVAWNPGCTNYSNVSATTSLYPGDSFVDIIAADIYSDMYPFSDGGATYHDWGTGLEDTSVAQFMASPANRMHYWSYPAATEWSLDGSGGHSQSFMSLLQFAEAHHKPFAIPETGAGNSNGKTDVNDDPTFPQWLGQQLASAVAAKETVLFVNVWNNNGGGNYEFSYASDSKPQEAAAWGTYLGPYAK